MGISLSRHWPDDYASRTLPLLALLMLLLKYAPAGANCPPVTAALIAANTLLYFRPGALDAHLPRIRFVTFNPYLIIQYRDLRRFFLSAFYHVDEGHLFNNMASLLLMGVWLETSIGSFEFASMVISLLGLSQSFALLLSKGLQRLGNDVPYYQYAAGFSGVLLGMNVVLFDQAGDFVFFGVAIPAKHLTWLEVLLTQALDPKASLVGHVGGVLAGLAYLCLKRGLEPLALMYSGIPHIVSRQVRFAQRLLRSLTRHRGSSVQGHVASVPRETGLGMWRCTTCCSDNSPCTDACETCSTPHQVHGFSRRQLLQDGDSELSVEEIRRRRLQRFET